MELRCLELELGGCNNDVATLKSDHYIETLYKQSSRTSLFRTPLGRDSFNFKSVLIKGCVLISGVCSSIIGLGNHASILYCIA